MAELRVTFDGLVAWVPRPAVQEGADPPAYAVLLPDAQFAEPASWSRERGRPIAFGQARQTGARVAASGGPEVRFPQVREPHTAMLHFDVGQATVPGAHAVIADPATQRSRAMVLLGHRRVTFSGLAAGPLTVQKGRHGLPLGDLPQMKEIAPGYEEVPVALDPKQGGRLGNLGLAGALEIDRGSLDVTREFANGETVRFGRVTAANGNLQFSSTIYQQPLGNQVTWTAPLAGDVATIELQGEGGLVSFHLIPEGDGVVRVAIANVELEVPVFRRADPFTPSNRLALPDPDFGVFYALASNDSRKLRRFVIPARDGAIGSLEKPCAPVVFSRFTTT